MSAVSFSSGNFANAILDLQKTNSNPLLASSEKYQMVSEEVQKIINSFQSWDEKRLALQNLAYDALSSPPYHSSDCCHQKLLAAFFYLDNSDPAILAALLLKSVELAVGRENKASIVSGCKTDRNEYSSWHHNQQIQDPEQLIEFTHGGGEKYIKDFLNGNHNGYAREAGGEGIFVTPMGKTARDVSYALRTPLQHFDNPIILRGQIPAKCLMQVNHNSYEAVIFPEFLSEIKNLQIDRIDLAGMRSKEWLEDLLPLPKFSFSGKNDFSKLYTDLKDHYDIDVLKKIEEYINEIMPNSSLF